MSAWRRCLAAACLSAFHACEAPPPAPVTLRIGVFESQGLLPYFVMQEQGFDKKNGLKFEETRFSGGPAVIQGMTTGAIDVCPIVGIGPVLEGADRGSVPAKVVPVASNTVVDPEHPGAAVLAGHAVQSWKDLAGKKIGINARRSFSGIAADIRLSQEGVSGYSFVEIPLSNQGLALAGGNVAAAAMIEPHLTQSLLRGDGRLLGWVIGGPPFERAQYESIVFSADFRRGNPEGVKAFLRAHLAAVRWINTHPDEARLVLGRRMNLSADVAKKVHLRRFPPDARADPALLEQTAQAMLAGGLLKAPINTRALHDQTLLEKVLEEAR